MQAAAGVAQIRPERAALAAAARVVFLELRTRAAEVVGETRQPGGVLVELAGPALLSCPCLLPFILARQPAHRQ